MSSDFQTRSFDDQVYTGFWINRVKGSTYGATLTLSRQAGNFLIAFLALYVGATGQSFWTISRFLLHKYLSSESQSDGVYHQHQAILRNSKTAPDAVQETLMLMIAWRSRTRRLLSRLLPIWTLACLTSVGFAIAGIFSSQVTANQSNEVLLRGPECGTSLSRDFDKQSQSSELARYRNKMYLDYLNYALACYQGQQTTQSRCQMYTKPKLSYEVDRNATCPFEQKMCQSASDNLQMDSGYLDSWGDLGMNAEPRFQIRLKQSCAPLVTSGYKMKYVDPTDPSKTYMRYSYLRNNTITNTTADVADWRIYLVPLKSPFDQVVSFYAGSIDLDYRTRSIPMYRGEDPAFVPELNRTDAYAALVFLDATDMIYHEKVEDPWFTATTSASEEMRTFFESESLYVSDEPATVIGCTSQVFYCNPEIDNVQQRCANLYASHESMDSVTAIWPEPDDLKAFIGYLQTNNIMIATPDSFYNTPGLPNLLARFTTEGVMQWDAFPRDRWKKEMEFVSQASLASFQSNVPQASQNGVWYLNRTLCDSETEAGLCEKLCKSQKVRSSEYYSFNVLGMAIIIFVGLLLMLLAAFIETITTSIANTFNHNKQHHAPYSRLEWESNSYLDLQRLAHQALGMGTWSRSRTGVPITAPGEQLGVLSATKQSELPVLKLSETEYELHDFGGDYSHQRDYSTEYGMDAVSSHSAHTPLVHTHMKAESRFTAQAPELKKKLPSHTFRRPGYARVYTEASENAFRT